MNTDALSTPPELPRATPVAGEPPPPVEAPGSPLATVSPNGEAFDPAFHIEPRRANVKGGWARKRGGAAIKAAGRPPVGVAARSLQRREGEAPAPAPAAPDAAPLPPPLEAQPVPSASRLVWDDPGAVPAGDALAGDPVQLRPREAYATTAKGIVRAQFGLAVLHIGPAWEPGDKEAREWTEAWQDVLHEYQLPVLGSILTIVVLLVDSIARRRKDPDTQRVGATIRDMILGRLKVKPIHDTPAPDLRQVAEAMRENMARTPVHVDPLTAKPSTGRAINPYGFIGK